MGLFLELTKLVYLVHGFGNSYRTCNTQHWPSHIYCPVPFPKQTPNYIFSHSGYLWKRLYNVFYSSCEFGTGMCQRNSLSGIYGGDIGDG